MTERDLLDPKRDLVFKIQFAQHKDWLIDREAMERRRQQAAIERQQREMEYTRWRRTLAVGSSTFCGYVIERNGPMVKIAVNTPLPGYAAEQWLKIDEVYPVHLGCRNRNGTLSTTADP